MERVDVNDLIDRIDWNTVVERLDLEAIASRSVRSVTRGTRVMVRQRLSRLDDWITHHVNRALRRRTTGAESSSSTGSRLAGPASRLVAFVLDAFLSIASITLIMATVVAFVDLITGAVVKVRVVPEISATTTVLWVLLYFFASWATAGRTPGMSAVGIHVLASDGSDITPRRAALRTFVFPLSFVGGIGLLGVLIGEQHRALHDVLGGTSVVYDEGLSPGDPAGRLRRERSSGPEPS